MTLARTDFNGKSTAEFNDRTASDICDDAPELEAIRFLRALHTTIAGVPLPAQRVTFVGEFGTSYIAPPSTASRSGMPSGPPADRED